MHLNFVKSRGEEERKSRKGRDHYISNKRHSNKHFKSILYQTENLCQSQNSAIFDVPLVVENNSKYGNIDVHSYIAVKASCFSYAALHALISFPVICKITMNFISVSHRVPVTSLRSLESLKAIQSLMESLHNLRERSSEWGPPGSCYVKEISEVHLSG